MTAVAQPARAVAPQAKPGAACCRPSRRRRRGRVGAAPLPAFPAPVRLGLGSARLGWAPRLALAPWPPTASTSPCATPPSPAPPPPPARSSACSTSGGRQPSTGERGGPGARPGVRGAGGAPGASRSASAGRPRRAGAVVALLGSRPDGGAARVPAVTGRCCRHPAPGEVAPVERGRAASPSGLP